MSDCDEHFSIFPRGLQISNTISCDSMNTYEMDEDNLSEKQTKLHMVSHEYGDSHAVRGKYTINCLDKMDIVSLDPISITPTRPKGKQTLNLQQTFQFPPNFGKIIMPANENCTQTTESLITFASNTNKTNIQPKRTVTTFSDNSSDDYEQSSESIGDFQEMEVKKQEPFILPTLNNSNRPGIDMIKKIFKPCSPKKTANNYPTLPVTPRKLSKPLNLRKVKSQNLSNQLRLSSDAPEISTQSVNEDLAPIEERTKNIPAIQHQCQITLTTVLYRLNDGFWKSSLQGLRELLYIAPRVNWEESEREISCINRKVIELFRSPRSMVCRAACQAAGELFRIAKCTKRPEYDDIVDNLLCKTGDSNRFIQKDANVALDKMVTYIPSFHSVRVLAARGPLHKSSLVRTATSRLLVCVCAIAGIDTILGPQANCHTRKRVLNSLAKFLTDKNQETRSFGERLYRMLRKHKFFEEYFFKDLEPKDKAQFKRVLQIVDRKFV